MDKYTYSIVVPAYNNQLGVTQHIEWFLKQPINESIQLIIVDDGSTVPIEIIDSPHIVLIRQQNMGVSAARNTGIQHACGTYLAFLDSDDYYENDVLITWHSMISGEIEPDVAISPPTYQYREKDVELTKINLVPEGIYSSQKALEFYLHKKIFSHICSILIKRDFVEKNCLFFNSEIVLSEDILYIVECLNKAKNVYIGSNSYFNYVIEKGSATNQLATKKVLNNFKAYDEISELSCGDKLEASRNYFVATMYIGYLIKLFENKTNDEEVIERTVSHRCYLKRKMHVPTSGRGITTLAFKLLSYMPSKLLTFLAIKSFKRDN